MFKKLKNIEKRYKELEEKLSDPDVVGNFVEYQKYAREHSGLRDIVETLKEHENIRLRLEEDEALLLENDEELKEIIKEEIPQLREETGFLENRLKILLLPGDPNDDRNIILEIRAGTGGDEAGLFVADLFRMYTKYAEICGWKVDIMSSSPSGGMGGFKEIILLVEGKGVYSRLKYESGVHRVQRVPVTETQGRIHTSAVTVAVLLEAEDVEVKFNPGDLRIDVYHSSGHGGQSVNTTDSAVRITHIPTGLVVTCQDEKSQHKNRTKAMKVLRSRLLDSMIREQNAGISETRKNQVGSGDRSERIRTYNFPQGRVSDHRIGLTLYNLADILNGNIHVLIDPLAAHYQTEAMKKAAV
jgi:peptide chain release factor 1